MKKLTLLTVGLVSLNLIACGKAMNTNAGSMNATSATSNGGSSANADVMQAVQQKMLVVQNERATIDAQIAQIESRSLSVTSVRGLNLSKFSTLVQDLEKDIQDLINQFSTQLSQLDPNDPAAQGLINQLQDAINQLQNVQSQLSGIVDDLKAKVQHFFDKINAVAANLPSPFNTLALDFLNKFEQKVMDALSNLQI